MKQFRFSLQAVLTVRRREEQLALSHYARAALAYQHALANLRPARAELESVWARLQRELTKGLSAIALAQLQSYAGAVKERHRKLELEAEACSRAVHHASQILQSARQQREVVDRYFERKKRGYQRNLQWAEQKMLDDLSARDPRGSALVDVNPEIN